MDASKSQGNFTPTAAYETDPSQINEISMLSQVFLSVSKYSDLVISPTIGVVGLAGNVLSGVIMVKDGLHKPSNILLLGLAVADFFFLLDTINVPRLIRYASPSELFWFLDLDPLIFCYSLTMTMIGFAKLGAGMSTSITVFITLERIVAVYFPLKLSRLVTPTRATVVVILSFLVALPHALFLTFHYSLGTVYYEGYHLWVGFIKFEEAWTGSSIESYETFISLYIRPTVPPIIVSIGCVLIGVKIRLLMRQRKRLTSTTRNRNSSARTRTLFMVCFLFSVANVCITFTLIPQLGYILSMSLVTYYITGFYNLFLNFLFISNSALNFFIYVIFHPKFRKLAAQFVCRKQPNK